MVNEIDQIDGLMAHVVHDTAVNMTRVPIPGDWSDNFDLTFDAWNRLVVE